MSQIHSWWWSAARAATSGPAPFPAGIVPRGPLPPMPPVSADGPPYTAPWFPPPAVADKLFWRCNFGCVTIPGLPWIEGMEGKNYDRVLTGFFGRYPVEWQEIIARTYYERGYTHFLRWVQDELIGSGVSVQAYVDQCKRVKDAGVAYVTHSFLSKTYAPVGCGSDYCHQQFDAVIDALLAADCLDAYTVGFEMNFFTNDPVSNDACIDYFTVERGLTEATGHPAYVHFTSGYTWQGTGARDRRSWWDLRRHKLTGLLYQCDPAWSSRMMQDRIRDTTDNAGQGFPGTDSGFGHEFQLVALEPNLQSSFGDNATLDEDDLDQTGYVLSCTPGQVPVMGFGCGGRQPSGAYL